MTPTPLPTAPFTDGKTPTREVRVATTGNDATGDGSSARPYATLSRAVLDATPGTAVVLAPGTYAGGTYVADLAGTEQAPIWIRGADPTNRPVLDGGTEGLHLTRVRWMAVENLEVRGCASNGINCDDGGEYANPEATRHMVFRNISIHDIGGTGNQDGLKLSGVNDFWVLDSEFARCGGAVSGSGIDMVGCHGGVVARCYLHDLSANAIQCKGGTAEIDILHCRIFDAGARGINIGGSTGFEYFRPPLSTTATNYEARAIRVVANLFRGGTAAMAFVGAVDCVAANNTIVDPEDWFFRILQETVTAPPYAFHPCGHCGFVNNLVYFDRARLKNPDVNVGPDTLPATFTFARNLWYARNAPGSSEPDLPTAEIHGLLGSDPRLGDPAAGVYTIGLPSPAAQAGANLAAVRTDYGGEDYLAPPSIGAFEIRGDADGDGLPDAWELRHFGVTNTTSGLPGEDDDGEGFDDRDEYVAGTAPRDSSSCLKITALAADSSGATVLAWSSVSDRTYTVYGATNWPDSGAFVPLSDGLRASGTQTGFTTATGRARAALFSVSVRP